jgi:hypothetical protein
MTKYFVILMVFFVSLSAYGKKCRLRGTYTSMRYNKESGDLGGVEIRFIYSRAGVYALFQIAEGGPYKPVLSKVDGNCDKFSIKTNNSKITGKLKQKDILGFEFHHPKTGKLLDVKYVLKKGISYWNQ